MLLRPTPADVCLDSIRVLLLYAQWMPFRAEGTHLKSRYNDVSAWAVLGLAVRYAVFLGLERSVLAPLQNEVLGDEDMSRFRVWINLVTCDCNLMLSSGLPASLDPRPTASVSRIIYARAGDAQPPDLRVTALIELAAIAYRALHCEPRILDVALLKKANTEMDEWEAYWVQRLRVTPSQHIHLPFTSLRMYRLTINSTCLGPLLSSSSQASHQPLQLHLLQSLDICLTAAAQTILALADTGGTAVWCLQSQDATTFPPGPFEVDTEALDKIYYAVDSTWISHTFAVTFLALCYVRGVVDGARAESVLGRLLTLAAAVFSAISPRSSAHPGRDFQPVVQNATTLVLQGLVQQTETSDPHDTDLALQPLFDLMTDAGLEWPSSLLVDSTATPTGWGCGITL
ncbi:uncharacterized protein EHS24_001537 [Apiotrichum porosum]|uniref:Xylanolytic transcriptional activator regulatory domain-containing protein n=1 Tax=Apiotrichum porosum TaxID=105984 RepID=A0A427XKS1_9TREE|nr:uncharacterized protein EHS24_001537 [Apiotrichum porosum]RSH79485.1 hypothetical protein EHS24_001537 [Apiotrichum porosum]